MYDSPTAKWISENWDTVSAKLKSYLTRSFPLSKSQGLIDSHLSHTIEYLLKSRSLDPFLEAGKPIKTSYLCQVAFCKTQKQIEKWGQDASLRTTRAASTRTEYEKKKRKKSEDPNPIEIKPDFIGPVSASDPETEYYFNEVLAILEDRLTGSDGDTYFWDLFQSNLIGHTQAEMAQEFGVSCEKIKLDKRKIKNLISSLKV